MMRDNVSGCPVMHGAATSATTWAHQTKTGGPTN